MLVLSMGGRDVVALFQARPELLLVLLVYMYIYEVQVSGWGDCIFRLDRGICCGGVRGFILLVLPGNWRYAELMRGV